MKNVFDVFHRAPLFVEVSQESLKKLKQTEAKQRTAFL